MILCSCGGGGGGGGSNGSTGTTGPGTVKNASFEITWPARSRTVALVNPLSSALSVAVTVSKADGTGAVTVDIDRDPSRPVQYTGTYNIPGTISTSVNTLTATFYSAAGEQGIVVGTATGGALVRGSDVWFGSIDVVGKIQLVTAEPATLSIGSAATQLTYIAQDSSGDLVPVSPGSETWTVNSGNSYLQLTGDGLATPQSPGTAEVTVTIDGITSQPTAIIVSNGTVSGATFQISWPTRTRTALNASLTSALSAAVTFSKSDGTDWVTVDAERDPSSPAAYSATYTIPKPLTTSVQLIKATFYAQSNLKGSVVGTATADASLSGTNVDIADIQLTGTIAKVTAMGASLKIGQSNVQLNFTTTGSAGQTIVVTPGSATWQVTTGLSYITISPDGLVTGLSPGTSTVTATVDGVKSAPATVTVLQ